MFTAAHKSPTFHCADPPAFTKWFYSLEIWNLIKMQDCIALAGYKHAIEPKYGFIFQKKSQNTEGIGNYKAQCWVRYLEFLSPHYYFSKECIWPHLKLPTYHFVTTIFTADVFLYICSRHYSHQKIPWLQHAFPLDRNIFLKHWKITCLRFLAVTAVEFLLHT